MNSTFEATKYAQGKVASQAVIGVGDCLGFMRDCYFGAGQHAFGGTAWTAYGATKIRGTGPAPFGALHFWKGGSTGAGHITLDIGGGNCISTDFGPNGYIGDGRARVCSVASIAVNDKLLTYVGWSRDLDGETPEENNMILVQKKDGGPFYHYTGNHIEQISDHQALRSQGMGAKLVILNDTDEVFTTLGPPPYAAPVAASGTVAKHTHPLTAVTTPSATGSNA